STDLADALHACAVRTIPVKCTAGLHNAVRHRDATTGLVHHGFLNVLVAAGAAPRSADDAAARLDETAADALLAELRTWAPVDVARARDLFTAVGTCAVAEGIADLVDLGLLSEATP